MTRKRGFGGIVNTNGVYDFSGKTLAVAIVRVVGNLIPKLKLMARL